jgi:hypothetical protein
MTIGRRGFLMAGGLIAGAGALTATDAVAAPAANGQSVTDFGVEPNSDTDQTKALQKAIDEISTAGDAVQMPGGTYQITAVQLPARCSLIGAPGQTLVRGQKGQPCFLSSPGAFLYMSGLGFEGAAIAGSASDAVISLVSVRGAAEPALMLTVSKSVSISLSAFEQCSSTAIDVSAEGGAILTGNHISGCAGGIRLQGSGNVNGNVIVGASKLGLRLGGGKRGGIISAINNTLRDCDVALGVAADGETILASLNLIMGAKSGAIRAFDGDTFVGPDLARESAEAYLNLTLVGNVAR